MAKIQGKYNYPTNKNSSIQFVDGAPIFGTVPHQVKITGYNATTKVVSFATTAPADALRNARLTFRAHGRYTETPISYQVDVNQALPNTFTVDISALALSVDEFFDIIYTAEAANFSTEVPNSSRISPMSATNWYAWNVAIATDTIIAEF